MFTPPLQTIYAFQYENLCSKVTLTRTWPILRAPRAPLQTVFLELGRLSTPLPRAPPPPRQPCPQSPDFPLTIGEDQIKGFHVRRILFFPLEIQK